jgi:hypothetical protein
MQFAILILLAVIASVLLYGREATQSYIQNFGMVSLVLVLVAIALALLYWVLKQIGNGLDLATEGVLKPIETSRWYSGVKVRHPRAAPTILVFALALVTPLAVGVVLFVVLIVPNPFQSPAPDPDTYMTQHCGLVGTTPRCVPVLPTKVAP